MFVNDEAICTDFISLANVDSEQMTLRLCERTALEPQETAVYSNLRTDQQQTRPTQGRTDIIMVLLH